MWIRIFISILLMTLTNISYAATFGETSTTETASALIAQDHTGLSMQTMGAKGGTLESLYVYVHDNWSLDSLLHCIYLAADSSLVAQAASKVKNNQPAATFGWEGNAVSTTLLPRTDYWIGFNASNGITAWSSILTTGGTANDAVDALPLDDPFATGTPLTQQFSAYGVYTETGPEMQAAGSYDQGTNWTNPTNATGAPDNSCATYDNGNQNILTLYNFGFSIPTDATIDSINMDFDGYGTQSQVARRDLEVQLTKTGGGANTGVGDLLENVRMVEGANCAASGVYNVTGQILWNTTWTYTEINASTFGINIADDDSQAHELGVDAVYVTVHYSEVSGVTAAQMIMIGGQ